MTRVTGIGVGAAAKVGGVVFIVFGSFAGFFALVAFLAGGRVDGSASTVGFTMAAYLIGLPAVMGLYGIVIAALWAWIYNLTARWHGGFVLTLKQES